MVYIGIVLYDWRKGNTAVDLNALDPLPTDLKAYNLRYGNIDADLVDHDGAESLLKAGARVRFTYSQQGPHICYSLLGLLDS